MSKRCICYNSFKIIQVKMYLCPVTKFCSLLTAIFWLNMILPVSHIHGQSATHKAKIAILKKKKKKSPRNIVFLIGDGNGLAQICAGYAANNMFLHMFSFIEVIGLMNTSSDNDYITDSAAGATAFSIGEKTKNGMIGMRRDSTKKETLVEWANRSGIKTGLVATCALTHATPGSFYGHQISRKMHKQIANDFYQSGVFLAMGGGYPYFSDSLLRKNNYNVEFKKTFMDLPNQNQKQIIFYDSAEHPPKYTEGRGNYLPQASAYALKQLNANSSNGFFLMIEGSQIDWGGHDNDSNYVINEVLDFDRTCKTVLEWAEKEGNTLVVITADHETGGLGLMGYDSLNKRPQMKFHNHEHSAIMVPVFAFGPGSEMFGGVYENTEIYFKMAELWRKKLKNKK